MPESCKMAAHPVYDREKIEAQAEAQALADADAAAVAQVIPADAPDLNRDAVLAADDMQVMRVYVPEWSGFVYVRQLSGAERDKFEGVIRASRNRAGFSVRATFAAEVICDKDGHRLFSQDDVTALAAKSAKALDVIADAAAAFNGLGASDQEALRKN